MENNSKTIMTQIIAGLITPSLIGIGTWILNETSKGGVVKAFGGASRQEVMALQDKIDILTANMSKPGATPVPQATVGKQKIALYFVDTDDKLTNNFTRKMKYFGGNSEVSSIAGSENFNACLASGLDFDSANYGNGNERECEVKRGDHGIWNVLSGPHAACAVVCMKLESEQ